MQYAYYSLCSACDDILLAQVSSVECAVQVGVIGAKNGTEEFEFRSMSLLLPFAQILLENRNESILSDVKIKY